MNWPLETVSVASVRAQRELLCLSHRCNAVSNKPEAARRDAPYLFTIGGNRFSNGDRGKADAGSGAECKRELEENQPVFRAWGASAAFARKRTVWSNELRLLARRSCGKRKSVCVANRATMRVLREGGKLLSERCGITALLGGIAARLMPFRLRLPPRSGFVRQLRLG